MTEYRNRILLSLPAESLERLSGGLEPVELPIRHSLTDANMPTEHVFFIESGLASVVASSESETEQIEVGHIGFEGMTGFHVLLGTDRTPTQTYMQVSGSGLQLPVARLLQAVDEDAALRIHLLRYIQTYQLQLAYSTLANGRYTIPERLARWLLMCQDRLQSDSLRLTHEFLALMLGVRRAGVTNEIHILEGVKAIKATRGNIQITNREKLEEMAGGSYGVPEAEYVRLIEGGSKLQAPA